MKNEDLFYAMSFLDEDLIEEANKVDTKAVVTPVKKTSKPKAKVIPLVAPWIAAAAALLLKRLHELTQAQTTAVIPRAVWM